MRRQFNFDCDYIIIYFKLDNPFKIFSKNTERVTTVMKALRLKHLLCQTTVKDRGNL